MNPEQTNFRLTAETVHRDPPVTRLVLQGRFDAEGLPEAIAAIDGARAEGTTRFLVDLGGLSFIGSAGIGIFLSLVEEMRGEGGVVFLRVPAPVLRIFDVLNVTEFLEIGDNDADALERLTAAETAGGI
ncbi:MAG: STAS domain-containing protein [Candidatus Eisenbacteria bacterium]|nr:STAS domain-containing protein [Candidatus Eisenbacteria bacterium]